MSEQLPVRDFRSLVTTLRRHWLTVVMTTLALMGLVAVLDFVVREPLYRSDVEVLVRNMATDVVAGQNQQDAERQMSNELSLAESRSVTDPVEERYGDELRIAVSVADRRDVLLISVADSDPELAQEIAAFYTETYLEVRQRAALDDLLEAGDAIGDRMTELDRQITALGSPEPNTADARDLDLLLAQRTLLTERLDQLTLNSDLTQTGSGRVISAANLPDEPVSPSPIRDLILAGSLGLILGLTLAYTRGILGERHEGTQELASALTGLPTLAELPRTKRDPGVAILTQPTSAYSEAVRSLRTTVRFITPKNRVVQVASAMPNDGKTTTSVNLAYALAADGQNVLLVDADLRNRGLTNMLGFAETKQGFASSLESVNAPATMPAWVDASTSLTFVPAGATTLGAAELLGRRYLPDVMDLLRPMFDVIVVDSAPLVPVTDGALVAATADTVLLTVGDETEPDDIERARRSLSHLGRDIAGIVINGRHDQTTDRYGHGYYTSDTSSRRQLPPARPTELRKRFEADPLVLSVPTPRLGTSNSTNGRTGTSGSNGSNRKPVANRKLDTNGANGTNGNRSSGSRSAGSSSSRNRPTNRGDKR